MQLGSRCTIAPLEGDVGRVLRLNEQELKEKLVAVEFITSPAAAASSSARVPGFVQHHVPATGLYICSIQATPLNDHAAALSSHCYPVCMQSCVPATHLTWDGYSL